MTNGIRFTIQSDPDDDRFNILTIRIPTDEPAKQNFEAHEAELALMRFNLGGAEQICAALQQPELAQQLFQLRSTLRVVVPPQDA